MTSKKADLKSEADPKKNTIAEKKFSEEVAKVLEDDDDDFEEFNQEGKREKKLRVVGC